MIKDSPLCHDVISEMHEFYGRTQREPQEMVVGPFYWLTLTQEINSYSFVQHAEGCRTFCGMKVVQDSRYQTFELRLKEERADGEK